MRMKARPVLKPFLLLIQTEFFLISSLSIVLGTVTAYWQYRAFDPVIFLLTLAGILFIHISVNSGNEYFDYMSGADLAVTEDTRFGGGTKVLPGGQLKPMTAYTISLVSLAAGCLVGLCLVERLGNSVLLLGLIGVIFGYFYTAPPLKLAYRGLGELYVGIAFGLLMVLGAYLVQARRFDEQALLIALVPTFLNMAAIVCHRYPDYTWDKQTGKKTIIVLIGKKRGSYLYAGLLWAAYVVLIVGICTGLIPRFALAALLTFPLALLNGWRFIRGYANGAVLEKLGMRTMWIEQVMLIILCLAYAIEAFIRWS